MEFLRAQRLKSGNSRSLIFGVLMFGPGLKQKISHECEGKFYFYICITILLISLSCWSKGKYSWSHLRFSGLNAIIFSREGLVQGCTRKNIKIYIFDMYIFNSFYLCHSCNSSFLICLCFNMVSFRGRKKFGPRPDRSPLGV